MKDWGGNEMRKHLYTKLNILIAVILAASLLLTAGGQPAQAQATTTEVTHAGPYILDANNQSMNFDEVWDLTQGDLVLTYDLDMSQITQPGSWPTGWVQDPSGGWYFDTTPTTDPAKYPDTYTPWVEVGMRG